MNNTHKFIAGAAFLLASQIGLTDLSWAQGTPKESPIATMKVNWKSPEIQNFVQRRATNSPRSLGVTDASKLNHLKLPVIAFDRPPGIVNRAFGIAQRPEHKRTIVTEPGNPNSYTIVDTYGDLTITIDADLRVQ